MSYFPQIDDAIPKVKYELGDHYGILYTDITSSGSVQYQYLLGVFNSQNKPVLFVSSEINSLSKGANDTHILGLFDGAKHATLDVSTDWGDESLFVQNALGIIQNQYGFRPSTPPANTGFSAGRKREPVKPKKKRKPLRTFLWIITIIAVLAGGFYATPFVIEWMDYNEAIDTNTEESLTYYIIKHDNSYRSGYNEEHLENTLYLLCTQFPSDKNFDRYFDKQIYKLDNFYRTEQVLGKYALFSKNLKMAKVYRWRYPNGEISSAIQSLTDSLIRVEQGKADSVLASFPQGKAKQFMKNLTYHLLTQGSLFVRVKMSSETALKDLEEYPEEKINTLNELTEFELRENMISLKSNFTSEAFQSFEISLKQVITDVFKRQLGTRELYSVRGNGDHGFYHTTGSFYSWAQMNFMEDYYDYLASLEAPEITFNYEIKNTILDIGGQDYPSIWYYTENNQFITYLMGVSVDLSVDFTLPNGGGQLAFNSHSDPDGDIQDIENVQEAYKIMVQRNISRFSEDIKENFSSEADESHFK